MSPFEIGAGKEKLVHASRISFTLEGWPLKARASVTLEGFHAISWAVLVLWQGMCASLERSCGQGSGWGWRWWLGGSCTRVEDGEG